MTTTVVWGPYFFDAKQWNPECLQSGRSKRITYGPVDPFFGTVQITAFPWTDPCEGTTRARTAVAASAYIQAIPRESGFLNFQYVIWTTLTNVGEPTVRYITVYITIIQTFP